MNSPSAAASANLAFFVAACSTRVATCVVTIADVSSCKYTLVYQSYGLPNRLLTSISPYEAGTVQAPRAPTCHSCPGYGLSIIVSQMPISRQNCICTYT